MATVLAGDTGDQRAFHGLDLRVRFHADDATRGRVGNPGRAGAGTRRSAAASSALADRLGGPAQALERAEEAAVRLVAPAHVARAAPARLAQAVEPAVVADAEVRVGLDVVAREPSELRPRVEEARPAGAHVGDRVAAAVDLAASAARSASSASSGSGSSTVSGGPVGVRPTSVIARDRTGWRPVSWAAMARDRRRTGPKPPSRRRDRRSADDDATRSKPPKAPTRLVLVRHAVTAQTGPLLSGRMPGIDLSEKGVGQAEATAAAAREAADRGGVREPDRAHDADRAADRRARTRSKCSRCPGVIEADYGDWTGGKIADLAKTDEWKVVQVAPSRARFPNGESITEMQARIGRRARRGGRARTRNETVVVVSHADPIKSAIAHYSGMHLDLFQRVHVSPASVTVLDFHAYGVMLVKCNDTGGLDDLLPEPDRRPRRRPSMTDLIEFDPVDDIARRRVRPARRAHVRDPGAQGRGGAVGARREGAGRACSPSRPSSSSTASPTRSPEEPPSARRGRRRRRRGGRAAVPRPADRHRLTTPNAGSCSSSCARRGRGRRRGPPPPPDEDARAASRGSTRRVRRSAR